MRALLLPGCALLSALLSGCAAHPITGRNQILVLPVIQAAHAEVGFALSALGAGAQRIAGASSCEADCGKTANLAAFAGRVWAIGAKLDGAARDLAPDLFARIDGFEIELNGALGAGSGSSAGGRIALGEGLAALEPTDTVIAFLLAREMAHVIARHAEENSGAALAFSALGLLLPGFNVVARFIATTVASSALKESWAAQQMREADEIALDLLARAGIPASVVALELALGVVHARLPANAWGARYLDSAERVERIAAAQSRYAASDN